MDCFLNHLPLCPLDSAAAVAVVVAVVAVAAAAAVVRVWQWQWAGNQRAAVRLAGRTQPVVVLVLAIWVGWYLYMRIVIWYNVH